MFSRTLDNFHIMIDSFESMELLLLNENAPQENKIWSVFLAIDIGYGRGIYLNYLGIQYFGFMNIFDLQKGLFGMNLT